MGVGGWGLGVGGWLRRDKQSITGRIAKGQKPNPQPLSPIPYVLFALAGLWGFLIAGERGPALRELRWLIVEPLVFCGLLLYYARRRGPGYWRLIVGFWLAGGALGGLVGVLQLLGLNMAPLIGIKVGFSEDVIGVEGVRRATGLYGHPNNLGLAMGRAWPVAAAMAHVAFWQGPGGAARLRRSWPTLLVTLLCLGGLLVSFSRGAYLGAAAAGVVLMLGVGSRESGVRSRESGVRSRESGVGSRESGVGRRIRGGRLALLIIAGVVILGGMAMLAMNVERFNLLGASSGIRVQTWASALAMLRDHPLGVGLDQFGRLYPQYIDPALAGTNEINTAHPHNLLLDIALRMGPLGLIAFGWLLVIFYRRMIARAGQPSPMRAVYVGALAAMTGALVHGLVDSFYFWPDLAFAFWLFLGLALWRVAE
ncbi:O-antigen ligase domain-containing protein [Chloroflexales bacterium ZM16-3]|nr:O-antigen ligase domain-containing protein [Chloroflexales bacterium ZM16-3]